MLPATMGCGCTDSVMNCSTSLTWPGPYSTTWHLDLYAIVRHTELVGWLRPTLLEASDRTEHARSRTNEARHSPRTRHFNRFSAAPQDKIR
jgi:hypothetical protein